MTLPPTISNLYPPNKGVDPAPHIPYIYRKNMPTINIMVFEDRAEYRRQIVAHLETQSDFRLVGESGNTWSVVERVRKAQPDVVLFDIEMPTETSALDGRAGIKAILALRDAFGEQAPAVMILTHFADDDRIFEAFCAGGHIGYLTKPVSAPDLADAIRQSAAGEPFSSPFIARRIRKLLGNPLNEKNAARLTPREAEALTYLKQGYSQQETAGLMGVTSVKDLLKSIYRKLDVHNLRQAENKVWYNHLNILRWLRKK